MSDKKNSEDLDFDLDLDGELDLQDLLELNTVMGDEETEEEIGLPEEEDIEDTLSELINKIDSGTYVTEAVRDVVFDNVKDIFSDEENFGYSDAGEGDEDDVEKAIKTKRKELYNLLENLDQHLKGKGVKEVAATFSSLLNIEGQLCVQQTDGVITVRTRLHHFFKLSDSGGKSRPELQQEISLIFSPEEISAMRHRLPDLEEEDPLRSFFSMVLDQAYDVVQYNEMTGYLLLEMTRYFLHKLESNGYGDTSKTVEFRERHERSKLSLKNAINELRDMENIVNKHFRDRPVLEELPKILRCLIKVKLGLMDKKVVPEALKKIYGLLGDYARARGAVAFDFNRLPSYQHGVRLRHSIILNLHKDVLEYTGTLFEKEFQAVKKEFEAMMKEIEAASEKLDPNSSEYEALMRQKADIMQRLETQRRKLDVVKSQETLVDVQHSMVGDAIKRYQNNEDQMARMTEELKNKAKIDPNKTRKVPTDSAKKKPSRMVMKKRLSRD